MPEERSKIKEPITQLTGRLLGLLLLFSLLYVLCIETWRKFEVIAESPDLTGDGRFTVLDIPGACYELVTAIGVYVQTILLGSNFGTAVAFLEMADNPPNKLWSGVLSALYYFMVYEFMKLTFRPLDRI